ncbi:hypothetical protein BXZ70DRAFT_911536 [Cristinia sonorae]|uniref:Uncharacterized protein n=1 Tax=Cristinia sonorae TaxID=1940300 RepID=A0A8K0UE28_9AGAR|nr:hypothetical protein BXZ70DRAFT_911536 [Cristinia sonorae]
MPRGGRRGYIIKSPTDSPQLPQTAQELEGIRQKSQHSPDIPRPAEKAQRPEESSNSLRRGYHTAEKGGEVSINWMMRKGKVLSRAVKRKYKEKKQDRNSDQGSGQAQRPSLNPGSPRGALSMDYVNLLEFKEQESAINPPEVADGRKGKYINLREENSLWSSHSCKWWWLVVRR